MQDKSIHIDDKFTDRAWADMRSMLDKEMPMQPEKRRRLLGWWWFALLGIGLVAGAGYLAFGEKAATKKTIQSKPVASATLSPIMTESGPITPPITASIAENVVGSKANKQQTATINFDKKQDFKKSNTPNSSGIELYEDRQLLSEKSADYQPFSDMVIVDSLQLETQDLNERTTLENSEYLALLSPVPLIEPAEKDLKVADYFAKKQGWSWALQASALAVPNFSGGGYSLEAVSSKALINNRLSINFGLGYAFLRQPINVFTENTSSSNDIANEVVYENSGAFVTEAIGLNGISINNKLLKLHYLTVPVQFSYRFSKRFSANAGAMVGLLLASKSDYTQDGILGSFAKQNNDLVFGASTFSKVSSIEIAAIGGFGFVCSPNSSLHFDYVHGLTDVLPDNTVGDFNRLIKLGFKYKIGRRH